MKVTFIQQHCPDGLRHFNPGDVAEFTEPTARFLAALGKVAIEGVQGREYQRRDMVAEKPVRSRKRII